MKGSGDEEQEEMNKDNPKNFNLGSDTTPNLDPETKGVSPIAQDWLESTATPFEKTILNQIQEIVSNSNLSKEILLPALGSILDMRQI
jgi:hypothetical protein